MLLAMRSVYEAVPTSYGARRAGLLSGPHAAATGNEDDFAYAILGGSGAYSDARGTATFHALSKTRVAVTIHIT